MHSIIELVDYYKAFELLLQQARNVTADYRTHFGMMNTVEDNYCFFSAIADPILNRAMLDQMVRSMDNLHTFVFDQSLQHKAILDVGCGTGGTLKKVALENPASSVTGINLNPVQVAIAQDYLQDTDNTQIIEGDFFQHQFDQQFDLLYFIESAFHMKNKAQLVDQIAALTNARGEVYLIDIFYPARVWARLNSKSTQQEIFEYLSVQEWQKLFTKHNFEISAYHNINPSVANHLQVRMSEEQFENEVLDPLFAPYPNQKALKKHLLDAFSGYKKLGKLFRRNMLEYGILKLQKKNA